MKSTGSDFLSLCKSLYFKKITPINVLTSNDADSVALRAIVDEFFELNKVESFCGFYMEYQYCVNLITAHFVFERKEKVSKQYLNDAIEIIHRYSTTPLNVQLAKEELQWLEANKNILN